ncbi:MAG: hypothetical protein GC182_02955 [Rhodopseudomonas sp.]|nr:hypothetical protein [Rhodopseudomonas sp.]
MTTLILRTAAFVAVSMIATAPTFAGGGKGGGFHSHATAAPTVRDHRHTGANASLHGPRQGGVVVYDPTQAHSFGPHPGGWGNGTTDHRGTSATHYNSSQWGGNVSDHR